MSEHLGSDAFGRREWSQIQSYVTVELLNAKSVCTSTATLGRS